MNTEVSSVDARMRRHGHGRSARIIIPLVLLAFACFAASAQAHTGSATATCSATSGNSVTLNWVDFANPAGTNNGGMNTPDWTITYKPVGGATTTLTGSVSFPLDSYSLTVAIPSGAAAVVASSSWTSSQTSDGDANSWSDPLSVPACLSQPAIATTASKGVAAGGLIRDSAVLSAGRAPTGSISFSLYKASDTTCATALATSTVAVNGNGTYDSPYLPEKTAGKYQWVASYSGDANNVAVSDACNTPSEQVAIAVHVVKGICVASPVHLTGVIGKVHKQFTAHLTGIGIKSVKFYLDRHLIKTVTHARHDRFSVTINARKLSYGGHRLVARVTLRNRNCARVARAGTFVRVKSSVTVPVFTG